MSKKLRLKTGETVLLDDDHYELVKDRAWRSNNPKRAKRRTYIIACGATYNVGGKMWLHRLLFPHTPYQERPHFKNGNCFDYRRENVEIVPIEGARWVDRRPRRKEILMHGCRLRPSGKDEPARCAQYGECRHSGECLDEVTFKTTWDGWVADPETQQEAV